MTIRAILILASLLISTQAHAERCALIENGTVKALKIYDACPPNPTGKPQFKWLSAPVVAPPDFDPVTQIRTGPTYTVGASSVTESWLVTSKSAEQIDADKQATIELLSTAVIRALCNHENRIRVLESKSGWTLDQCKIAFKALLP